MKVGNTVRILAQIAGIPSNDSLGVITNIDGAYILVQPNCMDPECPGGSEVELYPEEIEVLPEYPIQGQLELEFEKQEGAE